VRSSYFPKPNDMPLLIDAHEDLAWNILSFGRDFSLSAHEIRQREIGTQIPTWNHGDCLLGWPDFQRGQVAVVFATLFATPARSREGSWEKLVYKNPDQAYDLYRRSLEAYYRLVDQKPDKFRLILNQADLKAVLNHWAQPLKISADPDAERPGHPVGLVVSMEGAESIRKLVELEEWWTDGLRMIGPAWAGNAFTGGTGEPGPLTHAGRELLETMSGLGFGLDISHMDPQAALQAIDAYGGVVYASHSNVARLVKDPDSNRHLTDAVIRSLIAKDGVIGLVPYNRFLKPGWTWNLLDGRSRVHLQDLVAQIDTVCQMAGDARHAAIGTDFEGGFGWLGVPEEIDTIADLQKIVPLLAEKGYTPEDIEAIFHSNWESILHRILPEK